MEPGSLENQKEKKSKLYLFSVLPFAPLEFREEYFINVCILLCVLLVYVLGTVGAMGNFLALSQSFVR